MPESTGRSKALLQSVPEVHHSGRISLLLHSALQYSSKNSSPLPSFGSKVPSPSTPTYFEIMRKNYTNFRLSFKKVADAA